MKPIKQNFEFRNLDFPPFPDDLPIFWTTVTWLAAVNPIWTMFVLDETGLGRLTAHQILQS